MTSGRDASRETLDQRLAEARDSILFDGENIIAQEMGDQGQAVVLTQSRILIVKAGLAATGEMNGQRTAAYVFGDIESVKLRKGPMGAVIQVCPLTPESSTPGNPPMNVVVFGDPQKIKRVEALAEQITAAMGRPVDRIEPGGSPKLAQELPVEAVSESPENPQAQLDTAQVEATPDTPVVDLDARLEQITESEAAPKKGGREAKSLAEEMFGDMSEWTPPLVPAQPDTPAPEPVVNEAPPVERADNPWEDEWVRSEMQPDQVKDSIIESISEIKVSEPEPPDFEVTPELVAPEPETKDEFRPNPNLPTPAKKKKQTNNMLVVVAMLAVLVIAGMAVMAPLKKVQTAKPQVTVDVDALKNDSKLLQSELEEVIQYKAELETILVASNVSASGIQSKLRSGNMQAAAAVARTDASGKARAQLEALKTPAGLAAARDDIMAGLFTRKNASAAVTSSIDAGDALRKFAEADRLMKRGLNAIEAMQEDIDRRIAEQELQQNKSK